MPTLTKIEIAHLSSLTIEPTDGRRSLFNYWLGHFAHLDLLHTAIASIGGNLIGWAAANMGAGWNLGMIGVYIDVEFRNRGYARRTIDVLIGALTPLYPEWPQYLIYEAGKERLFRPSIERSIFKDWFFYREEYEIKEREMSAG